MISGPEFLIATLLVMLFSVHLHLSIGSVSQEWKNAYAFVYEATRASIAVLRPGVPISVGMIAYRDILKDSPYAEATDRLTAGRIAHGVGLGLIEPPSMSATEPTLLEEGMVLTVNHSVIRLWRGGHRQRRRIDRP